VLLRLRLVNVFFIFFCFLQVVLGGDDGRPEVVPRGVEGPVCGPKKVVVSPVVKWLRNLGLERYEEDFVREEIDWETLQWLTEEVCLNLLDFVA